MSPEASTRARSARAPQGVEAAPRQAARRPERAPLSVLDRKVLVERARRRRARLLLAASGLLVTGALGLVAGAQGVVASQQLHLDRLDQQLAAAVTRSQSLEVARARLAAPSRVLDIAERRLHMATPAKITYLSPVDVRTASPAARRRRG